MIKMNKNIMFFASIVLMAIWIPYAMLDYTSIPGENGKRKVTDIEYSSAFIPGDGKITGWEMILFFMVIPAFSNLMLIDYIGLTGRYLK